MDFDNFFLETLSALDGCSDFTLEKAKDEVIGKCAQLFGLPYNRVALEVDEAARKSHLSINKDNDPFDDEEDEHRTLLDVIPPPTRKASGLAPSAESDFPAQDSPEAPGTMQQDGLPRIEVEPDGEEEAPDASHAQDTQEPGEPLHSPSFDQNGDAPRSLPPIHTDSGRLHAISQLVAEQTGMEQPPSLYPVTDLWEISPAENTSRTLQARIAQFARELAAQAGTGQESQVVESTEGLGYACALPPGRLNALSEAQEAEVWKLLQKQLRNGELDTTSERSLLDTALFISSQLNLNVSKVWDEVHLRLFESEEEQRGHKKK